MFSDSFAGIAPGSVIGFVLAELAGAALGTAIHEALSTRRVRAGHPNVIEASGERQTPPLAK
jgi:hypothetical protein